MGDMVNNPECHCEVKLIWSKNIPAILQVTLNITESLFHGDSGKTKLALVN